MISFGERSGLKIAFVACNKNPARFAEDPSYIYRCENLAAGLRSLGNEVWLGHLSRFPLYEQFDWVVFHRPKATWRFLFVHHWLRSRGTGLAADFDDLVFDPDFAEFSPGVLNGQVKHSVTLQNFSLHQKALVSFAMVTVSTQALADGMIMFLPAAKVFVLPNAVHWTWRSMPEVDRTTSTDRPKIAYMPGTRSHDRDFSRVVSAIERVLDRHPEVVLSITGPLDFSLKARDDQLERHEKLPFADFHQRFSDIFVNIAPLEETPFTRCKSAIKVIEGAFWNVPTVCTSLPDADRFSQAGALSVNDADAFEQMLERLLADPLFYVQVSNGLRQRVLEIANVFTLARHWLEWVKADAR